MIIDQLFTRPIFEDAAMASPEQLAYNRLRAQWDSYQTMTGGGGNTAVSRDPAHAAKLATVPAELARMAAALKAKGIDAEAEYDALSGPAAAPVDANQAYGGVSEVAPPGAKAERMVKHIKAGYAKDGKLTPKEKGIAFATAWKAHNAGRVEEQGVAEGSIKDVEAKIRTHDQRKADREQAGDPYVAHEIHSHNVIRKQLLDKRKRAQAAYHKKMDQQDVAEGGYQDDSKEREENLRYSRSRNPVADAIRKKLNPNQKPKKEQGVAEGSKVKTAKGYGDVVQGTDVKTIAKADLGKNKLNLPKGYGDVVQPQKLKTIAKAKGVAEGHKESYIIVRTDSEGKKDVFAGNFDTYEQAQKELDACLAHPLHTKHKQKFEIKRKGQQDITEMDKSEPSAGRDTGPREGPDREAKPITAKKATRDAEDMLTRAVKDSHKKKDVKESDTLMIKLKRALVREGRVKELADDLKTMANADFMKKYGKAKAAIRKEMTRVDEATPAIPAAAAPVAAKPAGQQPFKPNQTMDPQQAAAANKAAQEFMQGLMAQLQQIKPVAESKKLNENWFTDKVAAAANWVQQKLKENPLIEIGLRFLPVTSTVLAITDVIGAIKGGNLTDATRMIANLIPGGQQLAQAIGVGQAATSGDVAGAAQTAANAAGLKDVASGVQAGQVAQAVSESALPPDQVARLAPYLQKGTDGSQYYNLPTTNPGETGATMGQTNISPAALAQIKSPQGQQRIIQQLMAMTEPKNAVPQSNTTATDVSDQYAGGLNELSTNKLAQYKTAAARDAQAADKAGDFKRGDKRFSGIVKATKKQFDNDAKKVDESRAARRALMARIVNSR